MELNDTFTIKVMDLDTKNLSYDIKKRELEVDWNKECEQHHINENCKIFCDSYSNFLSILTLDFYISSVLNHSQIERRTCK